jgi:hypothetical protein
MPVFEKHSHSPLLACNSSNLPANPARLFWHVPCYLVFIVTSQPKKDEPVDSGRSRVTQDAFARYPPTAEDNYFHEEEERRLHPPKAAPKGVQSPAPTEKDESSSLWSRIYRALTRTFDTDWRP